MADDVKDQPPTPEALTELRAIVAKAKGGDETALPRLRELLDAHPRIWLTSMKSLWQTAPVSLGATGVAAKPRYLGHVPWLIPSGPSCRLGESHGEHAT